MSLTLEQKITAMPKISFFWRECYEYGWGWKEIGVAWGKKEKPAMGEYIYRRCIAMRYCVKFRPYSYR